MAETLKGPARQAVTIYDSLDGLLAELDEREPFASVDSLSGSGFETARYGGERVILKYVCVDDDWIMRATGDIDCRLLRLFASEVIARLPGSIDHTTVAVAPYPSRHGHRGAVLLMRDVSPWLIPPGNDAVALDTHLRFIDHMAELHAATFGYADGGALIPLAHHYTILTPLMAGLEAQRRGGDPVPLAVAQGWAKLPRVAPRMAGTLESLAHDPGPLLAALQSTPSAFVHGDWKLGNLGERWDGTTILLDWDRCGAAPPTFDLAWYLAVNCDRLPQSKEACIDTYRAALQRRGVATERWWERQLALTLLGAALQLGWSKVDDATELGWWQDRVGEGARFLA